MIDYPVRLTVDLQIVDKFNRTVVPDLTWKGDLSHIREQRERGELIVNLLNAHSEISHNPVFQEPTPELVAVGGQERRGRGRPRKYA